MPRARVVPLFVVLSSLLAAAPNALAELVYVDAVDGLYHPNSASPNTFRATTDSATDWVTIQNYGDYDDVWGFRNTGPGGVAYGASAYQGKTIQNDPALYTRVDGLVPGASYGGLRLYFIGNGSSSWPIQYSLDGASWSDSIHALSSGAVPLEHSTTDPFGAPTSIYGGDQRYYYPIAGTLTADGSGALRFYVRPAGSLNINWRTVYDGFTYEDLPTSTATDPQPPDQANFFGGTALTSLSWSNPPAQGTITCNVYFGTQHDYDPGNADHFGLPLIHSNVPGTSVPVPSLAEGNQYFWIVDCVDSAIGLLGGELWTFEVLPGSAATGVILSEFMAANDSTLTNSLGGVDDWIELYNNSASTIDLGGWYLTDSPNELAKWQIPSLPATLLAPDTYLVIWASNENTVTNGEIHTSFRLSASGEYLALVRPDGVTVEHEYSPGFPEQVDDISYGIDVVSAGEDVIVLPSQAGCRYQVPTSDPGTAWHHLAFEDGAWTTGATGVGYETMSTAYLEDINTDLEAAMYNQMASVYVRIPFVVDDPSAFSSLQLNMRFDDGFVAYINGVEVARSNAPAALAWNATATTTRDVSEASVLTPFVITNSLPTLLVTGTNILALHGLNRSVSSTHFLLQPQLEGTLAGGYTLMQPRYYSLPTPGAPNNEAFLGLVADTTFSVDRGFYSSPIAVSLGSQTGGAAIRYTLDGTTPTEVHGTLYSGPIPISTTTVLRAIAYKAGFKSSNVDTHTYIFVEDVMTQPVMPTGWPASWAGTVSFDPADYVDYEMDPEIVNDPQYTHLVQSALTNIPTLSLVTDLDNLLHPDTGIYANLREEGIEWERPVSAEWIDPDGTKGFQENCGIRIQGGGSRGSASTPKHSLRLIFKGIYGATKLNFRMFADSDVDSFDTIHLRATYNDSWVHWDDTQRSYAQENQDQFARDIQQAMGQETIVGDICHLYLNGLYWGVYHVGERPDASWAASHFGGAKEEWDALNAGEAVDGNETAWNAMWAIADGGLSSLSAYTNFMQYCDVTSLIDYLIIMHYVDNIDWDTKNNYAVRKRRLGETFKFVCWDTERGLNSPNSFSALTKDNAKRPSGLFQRARANSEFRLLFADRVHKHLFNDGPLTPSVAAAIWQQRSAVVDTVIAAEAARWGDHRRDVKPRDPPNQLYTPNTHYYPRQSQLLTSYFPVRTANLLAQYRSGTYDLYPSLNAPEFSQHGGTFSNAMSVTLSGPAPIYYTLDGSDPREFGTGNVLGTPYAGAISLTHSTRIKARCYNGSQWSALLEADFLDVSPSPLRISEVMYAPRIPDESEAPISDVSQQYAFVEIHNTDPSNTVGLVGVSIADGLQFDFSKGSTLSLPPGGYLVVVENPAAFAARYPLVTPDKIAGEYRGDLTFSGDSLKLLVQGVGQVVSFDYSDGRGWPLAADQAGHSLIPLVLEDQSSGQLDYGGNWKASVEVDGSPGGPEPSPFATLALNEIIAHTDFSDTNYPGYDSNDKIELINYGVSTVPLNGYYLSDDPSFLKKWAIPAGINVPAGGMIVFDEVTGFHAPLTNGFGVDKSGEAVLLSYASGDDPASVIDSVAFKGQESHRSLGRYPDAAGYWLVCLPTPGDSNVLAAQRPVISEIMYHPTSAIPLIDNTADEFIEIFNPTAAEVSLWSEESGTNLGAWRVDGEVEYVFPDSTVLPADSRLLVVSFDPANVTNRAAFLARYGLNEPQNLFGPFSGKLSNQGGRVALEKPLASDLPGQGISWGIVDEVFYADDTPWAPAADGLGDSLHRVAVAGSGRDPGSWASGVPTPGSGAGAIPELQLQITHLGGQLFRFGFSLPPGFGYTLEMKSNGVVSPWSPVATMAHPATQYDLSVPDTVGAAYFRLSRDP